MDEVSLDVLVTVIRKDEVAWKTFISVANWADWAMKGD